MVVGGQRHSPTALPPSPVRETRYPLHRRLDWRPGPVWTGAENLARTGIRSPDRPARNESLFRLSYPRTNITSCRPVCLTTRPRTRSKSLQLFCSLHEVTLKLAIWLSQKPRTVQSHRWLKADSHIACRAHAVPLPCRAAKGLECVFPI